MMDDNSKTPMQATPRGTLLAQIMDPCQPKNERELAAKREIERLQDALKKANDQAERFEREWYLRGDALEWYRDEAKALAKNMEGGAHTSGVLASVTVLSLDAGRRADAVLSREHEASADCWCGPEVDYVDPDTGAKVFVHRSTQ